jgi:hypothetical protein
MEFFLVGGATNKKELVDSDPHTRARTYWSIRVLLSGIRSGITPAMGSLFAKD